VSAVDAAVAVAEAYGLRCDKPIVLSEAWHVLVHLWPSPVVARVTSGAAGVDPADVERELTVARHAARAGAPVDQPSDLLPPGPHRRDGHTLVFWRYLARTGELDPAAAGRGLCRIHHSLVDYDGELPRGGRAAEVRAMLAPFAPRTTSSFSANWPRASFPRGRRCTAMPTSSTASRLLPGPSGTTWRPRAAAHANTTLPRLRWTSTRKVQIRRLAQRSPRTAPTTRTSSSRRSRCTPPGWPRRSWLQSPDAQTPRRHSSASYGFCAASAGNATRTPL
jgi:hypothetical protein